MEDGLRGNKVDGSRNYELEGEEEPLVIIHSNWRTALGQKALHFGVGIPVGVKATWGYKVFWYLYSADIWFGNFPLLKFIVGVNIAIWLVWLWKI